MTISKHPDIATLMTCSAGSTPEALCAVVTSHLSMCPACLDELRSMEKIGVALFEELESISTVARPPKMTTVPKHESAACNDAHKTNGDVPSPLVDVIGRDLDTLDWQPLAPGLSNFTIPITLQAKGDLRLIKLEQGRKIPEHRHTGEELILVLRGSCRDGASSYSTGDFAEFDDENKHSMVAGPDGCILLIGNEALPTFISQLNERKSA